MTLFRRDTPLPLGHTPPVPGRTPSDNEEDPVGAKGTEGWTLSGGVGAVTKGTEGASDHRVRNGERGYRKEDPEVHMVRVR